jgi:beta-glucanase (GH16 family)
LLDTNGRNHSVDDTFDNYHTYEIDWQTDSVTWSIDGNTVRTVKRADTWNATTKSWAFPQSPARVQLSLWPAGSSSNAPGTVDWAGGLINWNSPDVQQAGYFYAMIKEVTIQCYDPPAGAAKTGDQAYIYQDKSGLNNSVEIVDKNTVLKSLLATGENPNVAISSGAAPSATAAQVPGADSANTGGNGANANQGGSGSGNSGSGSSPTSGGDSPSASTFYGFSQNGNSGTSAGANLNEEKMLQGSMLAVLLAITALLVL